MHRRNEEIVRSKTKHFKLLSNGFYEIQPFAHSISICRKILDEIKELSIDDGQIRGGVLPS